MTEKPKTPYCGMHICEDCGDGFLVMRVETPTAARPAPKWCTACRPRHTGFGKRFLGPRGPAGER